MHIPGDHSQEILLVWAMFGDVAVITGPDFGFMPDKQILPDLMAFWVKCWCLWWASAETSDSKEDTLERVPQNHCCGGGAFWIDFSVSPENFILNFAFCQLIGRMIIFDGAIAWYGDHNILS